MAKVRQIGTPFLKPEEAVVKYGGFVPTTDPSIPEAFKGTAEEQQAEREEQKRITRGGGTTQFKADLIRWEKIRKAKELEKEKARQEALAKAEAEKKAQQEKLAKARQEELVKKQALKSLFLATEKEKRTFIREQDIKTLSRLERIKLSREKKQELAKQKKIEEELEKEKLKEKIKFKIRGLGKVGEIYDPRTNTFISPSPTGFGATGFMRQPTPEEQIKIDRAKEIGSKEVVLGGLSSLFSLGTTALGTGLTEEEIGELYDPDSFIKTLGQVIDPRQHFKVVLSRREFEKSLDSVNKNFDKLEKDNKDFDKKWASLEDKDKNLFLGSEAQFNQYSKDYNRLNAKFNAYTTNPEYQKVMSEIERRKTIGQRISESDKSSINKLIARGQVAGIEFLSFVNPIQRVVIGGESLLYGGEAIFGGEKLTTKQKIKAGIDVGIGAILLRSGFRGGGTILGKPAKSESVLGRIAKWEKEMGFELLGRKGGRAVRTLEFLESRGAKALKTIGLPTGIGTAYGISEYKQTGDLAVSLGAGLGATTGILIPMAYESIRSGTRTTTLERQKLIENINKLEKSQFKFEQYIYEGTGSRPNTDRVTLIGKQKYGKFERIVRISGDLKRLDKGFSFFPDGVGSSTTIGKIKLKGQAEKGIVDVQAFRVGQVSKGINLGEIKDFKIGASGGMSVFVPKVQVQTLFKIPKGRGIVLDAKIGIQRLKQSLSKKSIKKGGDIILNLETQGRTITAERKIEPPLQEPFQKKVLKKIDITKESIRFEKISKGRQPISEGLMFSEESIGKFVRFAEPPIMKVIKKAKIKKTPFSKTFEEPSIKRHLKNTELTNVKKDTGLKLKEKMIDTSLKEVDLGVTLETAKIGLKGKTQKAVADIKQANIKIPAKILRINSRIKSDVRTKADIKADLKADLKMKAKMKADLRSDLQVKTDVKADLRQDIRADLRTDLMTKMKNDLRTFTETKMMPPRVKIPIRRTPTQIRPPPIFPRRKKLKVKKQIEKAPSYDVLIKFKGKYRKVTKKPISFQDAKDLRAYALDRSLARTGRIEPKTNKPSPLQFSIPRGYAKGTEKKFRDFRQKKGVRKKLVRTIIEKSKFIGDTKSEQRSLNVFKVLAKREKKRMKKNLPVGLQFN